MKFLQIKILFLAYALHACASLNIEPEKATFDEIKNKTWPKQSFENYSGLSEYTHVDKKYFVEWFSCKNKKQQANSAVVILNMDSKSFNIDSCAAWQSQTMLAEGFDAILVNRNGYGKSSPVPADFGGPLSQSSSIAAIKAASQYLNQKQMSGIWAYGSATITAGFVAKTMGGYNWLILGGGIYDLEEFSSKNINAATELVKLYAQAKESYADDLFYEQRSLGWDTSSLPPKIMLYHGKQDQSVAYSQTEKFQDTLATEEYKVEAHRYDSLAHNIPEVQHRLILERLFELLSKNSK